VQLLARFAQKVTFAFDGDRAGQEAIKRSVPIVEKKGLLITVVKIPGGKDPDEALKNEPALFKKAVREDTGVYDYLLDKVTEGVDLETAAGKKQVSEIMLPFLSEINNEIVKEHYVRKISGILNSSYESVARELERFGKTHLKRIEEVATPKQKRSKEEVLEEYLLALILQSDIPKQLLEKSYEIFGDTFPEEQATQKLFQRVKEYVAQVKTIDMEQFGKGLPQELLATYNTCVLYPISSFGDDEKLLQEVEKTAQKLATLYVQKRMRQLAGHISEKEARGEDVSDLQKEYSALTHRLETS